MFSIIVQSVATHHVTKPLDARCKTIIKSGNIESFDRGTECPGDRAINREASLEVISELVKQRRKSN